VASQVGHWGRQLVVDDGTGGSAKEGALVECT